MNIGIIVYSKTGNTLSVGESLRDMLKEEGHTVKLEKVTAFNDDASNVNKVQLDHTPNLDGYEVIIFGGPVHGFSISPVMKAYFNQIETLKDKRIGCFVTHFFPFAWMGGSQTIKQMKNLCQTKQGEVYKTGIVNWSRKRIQGIDKVLENMKKI